MAGVLEHLFKQLLYSNDRSLHDMLHADRVHWKRRMCGYLDCIMNHLNKMMIGYENEKVQGLIKELEGVAKDIVWHNSAHHMFDMMLEITEEICNIKYGSNIAEDSIVGFEEEVKTLLDQLTATCVKQFQVFTIAGMAGIGKTTLARKLYQDPLIEYLFDIRAWTCVSQVYMKRDLLLGILSSIVIDLTEMYIMSDEQLGEKLYRLLKGRKYFVVLDDIWDCKVWNDLKIYFPDDRTGSRLLFTSRDIDVSLHVGAARPAHVLRLRTEDESWNIFQRKVFRTGICTHVLQPFGRNIARKCEGLPLAIVISASLAKKEVSIFWWMKMAESLSSLMVSDPSRYMDSLALSFNHLSPHIRPCFLFLGSFPEDYEIPVTKLIWLWIAHGLIHETGSKNLEDVAEDILMDLIKRSLLTPAKKKAGGKIKTCHFHDLLRDFCLRKAMEDNFSLQVYKYAPVPESSTAVTNSPYTATFGAPALPIQTGLCYPFELGEALLKGGSIFYETYNSLAVLDVESVPISLFPSDVTQLVNLRYLAIQAHDGSPKASISSLVNLQMLIISSKKNITVPKTIWDMINLRHLCIKSGENQIDDCTIGLSSLQTLSQISPQSCQLIFSRSPNLTKLGFCGPLISSLGDLDFPNINSLQHLKKLKLLNTTPYFEPTRSCNPIMLPENLKRLTLSNTGMDWEEMWTFSLLPNLEVLKLKFHACIGEKWDTSDAEFKHLKVLKLHGLDLRQWFCSRDNFPRLQCLVVHHCLKLNSIPSDLGKILTLEMIEVRGCSISTKASVLRIQQEQESEGNCFLKVHASNNLDSQHNQKSLEQKSKKPRMNIGSRVDF